MTTLNISSAGLNDVIAYFRAEPQQIRLATARAIKRTATHTANEVRKGMAPAIGAKPAVIKKRVTARMLRAEGLVWIGLNPLMPIHLAGSVSQQPAGVKAGNRFYQGAFFKQVYKGGDKVWIRLRSKHYDADTYPYKSRSSSAIPNALRHRFPVVLAKVQVDTSDVATLIRGQATAAGPYLTDLVRRELDYRTRSRA
jgi:hypothetical protein